MTRTDAAPPAPLPVVLFAVASIGIHVVVVFGIEALGISRDLEVAIAETISIDVSVVESVARVDAPAESAPLEEPAPAIEDAPAPAKAPRVRTRPVAVEVPREAPAVPSENAVAVVPVPSDATTGQETASPTPPQPAASSSGSTGGTAPATADRGVTSEEARRRLREWIARVNRTILARAARDYPRAAVRRGIEGTVQVQFSVAADGRIASVRVARGADSDVLDEAAVRAVQAVGQLPPPPEVFRERGRPLTMPITYRLE